MANQYDVRFLAAAIKANYLAERRAKFLFEEFAASGAAEKGQSIADFARERGHLSDSQIDIIQRVIGSDPAKEKKPASRIGPYEPMMKLGSGGMGVVIKARHLETGEVVALKVLPRRLYEDPEYITRFVREANNASKLNHPNIMRGLGADKTADGLYYYAMELIDGESVQEILDRMGTIPESQAVAVCVRVCRALQHAQEHGIVHRDIKPENIMINREGKVKLTDLGLAKETVDSTVTQTGIALGTPHYMSPEQARGEREIDIRSDLYSLGATLYHMVTGDPPFAGKSAAVVITKHLMEQVPYPRDIRPELSDGICQVIQRMMAKEPEDRYATPYDTVEDLEMVARGEEPRLGKLDGRKSSVRLPEATSEPRSVRTARRAREKKPVLIPILSFLLTGAVIGLVLTIIAYTSGPTPPGNGGSSTTPSTVKATTTIAGQSLEQKLDQAIRAADNFESAHSEDPAKQGDIIIRWEKLLALSRGTRFEKVVIERLDAARKRQQDLLKQQEEAERTESLRNQFRQLQQRTGRLMEEGEWLKALHIYDGFSNEDLTAGLAQEVLLDKKRIRAEVAAAASKWLKEMAVPPTAEGILRARRAIARASKLGFGELEQSLEDLRSHVRAYEEGKERGRKADLRGLRVAVLGEVLKHTMVIDFLAAQKALEARIDSHEFDAISEMLRAAHGHLTALGGAWHQTPERARSLLGTTREHLGFKGKVVDVREENLILEGNGRRMPLPLRNLPRKEILELLRGGTDPEKAEYHLRSAMFLLYQPDVDGGRGSLTKARGLGADTRSFDEILRALGELGEESDAEKALDQANRLLERREWEKALAALQALRRTYGHTSFVLRRQHILEDAVSLALREGRPRLLHAHQVDLPDGSVRLEYDFSDPRHLRDWVPAEQWAAAENGLALPRTNWLMHIADFERITDLRFSVRSSGHLGLGLAHVGWAIGVESFPTHLFRLDGLKAGLVGRFFSAGENESSLWLAPDRVLIHTTERALETGKLYDCVVQRSGNALRWAVNGHDLLRHGDLPSSAGGRLTLINGEAATTFQSVSVQGKLSPGWITQAEESARRHADAIKAVGAALKQKGSARLLPNGSLAAWHCSGRYWSTIEREARFLGGPGSLPCSLPLVITDGTLSGSFRLAGDAEASGWQLGLRRDGVKGYDLVFSPSDESVALTKTVRQPEDEGEPYGVVEVGAKPGVQFVPGSWHHFEVGLASDRFRIALDGETLFVASDETYRSGGLILGGLVQSGSASPVYFRDLVLRVNK